MEALAAASSFLSLISGLSALRWGSRHFTGGISRKNDCLCCRDCSHCSSPWVKEKSIRAGMQSFVPVVTSKFFLATFPTFFCRCLLISSVSRRVLWCFCPFRERTLPEKKHVCVRLSHFLDVDSRERFFYGSGYIVPPCIGTTNEPCFRFFTAANWARRVLGCPSPLAHEWIALFMYISVFLRGKRVSIWLSLLSRFFAAFSGLGLTQPTVFCWAVHNVL